MKHCKLCDKEFEGYGHNGNPLVDGIVCDNCNQKVVTARLLSIRQKDTETKNITLLKYKTKNGLYKYEVMDKFDCPDEVERLDKMILRSKQLEKEGNEILWIKNTVII